MFHQWKYWPYWSPSRSTWASIWFLTQHTFQILCPAATKVVGSLVQHSQPTVILHLLYSLYLTIIYFLACWSFFWLPCTKFGLHRNYVAHCTWRWNFSWSAIWAVKQLAKRLLLYNPPFGTTSLKAVWMTIISVAIIHSSCVKDNLRYQIRSFGFVNPRKDSQEWCSW